jgi:hypothetical protein
MLHRSFIIEVFMRLKEWLGQRLDDTWSAHRLVHMLQDQALLTTVRSSAEIFDPIVLCRFLLSYLHFNTPAHEKQFRVSFRELAEHCVHFLEIAAPNSEHNFGDPKWVRVIAALLIKLIPPPIE